MSLSETLLHDGVARNACWGAKFLALLSLSIGLVFGLLLSCVPGSLERDGQQLALQKPTITMPSNLQPGQSAFNRFQSLPVASNRFQMHSITHSTMPFNRFRSVPMPSNRFRLRAYQNFESLSKLLTPKHDAITLASAELAVPYKPNLLERFAALFRRGTSASSADKAVVVANNATLKERIDALEGKPLWSKLATTVYYVYLMQMCKDFVLHMAAGFKLLFADTCISTRLVLQQLRGKQLSYRERRQLVRTTSDLFRLIPFSPFVIIPGFEFLLPFALKLFPGLLPSQFQSAKTEEDKRRAALKVKVDMAKFLVSTLDEMAEARKKESQEFQEFTTMLREKREAGLYVHTKELRRYTQLFKDKVTLDKLPRPQLKAISSVLQINPVGTDTFLRWQVRMELWRLHADDVLIRKEGVESLTMSELQTACRERGMRSTGISEAGLRSRLQQWIDLHVVNRVPSLLLLLSRTLFLSDPSKPEELPLKLQEQQQLKPMAAIDKRLKPMEVTSPDEIDKEEAERPIPSSAEDKLLILREEEALIKKERKEMDKAEKAAENFLGFPEGEKEIATRKAISNKQDFGEDVVEEAKHIEKDLGVLPDVPASRSDETQPTATRPLESTEAALAAKDSMKLISALASAAKSEIDLERMASLKSHLKEEEEKEVEEEEKEVVDSYKAANTVLLLTGDTGDAPTSVKLHRHGDSFMTIKKLIVALKALSVDEDPKSKIFKFAHKSDVDKDGNLGAIEFGLLKKAITELMGEGAGTQDEAIEAVVQSIVTECDTEQDCSDDEECEITPPQNAQNMTGTAPFRQKKESAAAARDLKKIESLEEELREELRQELDAEPELSREKIVSTLSATESELEQMEPLEEHVKELREELREELDAEPEPNRKMKEKEVAGLYGAADAVLLLIKHLEKEKEAETALQKALQEVSSHDGAASTVLLLLKHMEKEKKAAVAMQDALNAISVLKEALADSMGKGVTMNSETVDVVVNTLVKDKERETGDAKDEAIRDKTPAR